LATAITREEDISAHHAAPGLPVPTSTAMLSRMSSSPPRQPDPRSSAGRALVTGATAGIGLEFAHQLARRGHDLVLVARDEERLDTVATELRTAYGVDVEVLPADLTDRAALAKVESRVASRDEPIELLVNNAGFGLKGRFLDNAVEQEQAMLDVLVTAVMRLTHAALGPMAERGHGGVINVSSVAAFLPRGTYAAAKAWVNSFSEWAANEYRPSGVTVMALCPGFTKTEFHQRMGVRRGTSLLWMEPGPLVKRALSDFDKGRTFSIPGAQYRVIVALTKVIPSRALQGYQSMGRK
jgi:short-subunit dehydrogenase